MPTVTRLGRIHVEELVGITPFRIRPCIRLWQKKKLMMAARPKVAGQTTLPPGCTLRAKGMAHSVIIMMMKGSLTRW